MNPAQIPNMSYQSSVSLEKHSARRNHWWGPFSVSLGAALWGIETLFRVNLQQYFSSDVLVFFEHVIAVIILLPLLLNSLREYVGMSADAWKWLFISGVIGSSFGTVFFTASLSKLNLSVANLLLNLQPLVSVTLARLLLKEKVAKGFGPWALTAIVAGALISVERFDSSGYEVQEWQGLLFVLGTIICWGAATVAGRGLMSEISLKAASSARFVAGMFGCLIVILINGHWDLMGDSLPHLANWVVLKEYLWLLLAAGMTPLFFYFYGLKHTSAVAGAFCEMSQTLSALLVTWLVMGQTLHLHQILAGLILVIAVLRVNILQARLHSKK
jgi:DME family drug/metabolite transporter